MSDYAIRVQGLAKKYEIMVENRRHDTLRDQISEGLRSLFHRNRHSSGQRENFWALKDLSFEVTRGEVIGVIGPNGAGKSTLLKILSRITAPTAGSAEIRGRVGSLLEVGTGFHPELTGRENIYLNGAILGMKKTEIEHKFDEIVGFAEVQKFIDTPVKRYSSGMYVRLAFAVAAHLESEILFVDEVLAVGDAMFQKKCLGKMGDVARQGRTILFVSHNMAAIEHLCHRALVIRNGQAVFHGGSKEAIECYLHSFAGERLASNSHRVDLTKAPERPRQYPALLKQLELFTDGDKPLNGSIKIAASFKAYVHFHLENPTSDFDVCLRFDNLLGQPIFNAHTVFQPDRPHGEWVGDQTAVCEIPSLTLVPGEYKILVVLVVQDIAVDVVEDAVRINVIESDYYGTGKVPWNGVMVLKHRWYMQHNGRSGEGVSNSTFQLSSSNRQSETGS
jgi:lipopolysaccharide transport system ATP-binding protein